MKAHNDLRPEKCSVCGMEFRSISHLNRHKNSHVCKDPFFTYMIVVELIYVIPFQSDEKKYSCSICGNRFAYAYNRNFHEKQHSGDGGVGTPDKKYVCSICGTAYSRKTKLKVGQKQTSRFFFFK